MAEWRFPSNDHGENKGINDSGVAMFRGTPLKSLAREICQNSLDASRGGMVVVEFNRFSIKTSDIPGFAVLKDTFHRCLDFWGMQKAKSTKEFYENAIKVIDNDETYFLRISDFNTCGLTGSREEINTNWTNLTKSSGASDKKGTAGGSYGIGKYAPFACSDFSTVFYSTYDENEEEAYQGVSRLVTFRREDNETTQGTGYYGNDKNTPVFEQLLLDPGFKRDKGNYGTDIYIAGYKYATEDWEKNIIISVLDGFLGAIWNKQLKVIVGHTEISNQTLNEVVEVFRDDLTGYTEQYYMVLTSDQTKWRETDFFGLGNVRLGILIGDPEAPKRVAMIRQTGMKIKDQDHLPGRVPFSGVMFIEGEEINKRLRSIENPEHTEWQPERSRNPIKEKELLRSINKYIRDYLEEVITTGSKDEMDAAGAGVFLPDEEKESEENTVQESIGDKVAEIEKNPVRKRTPKKETKDDNSEDNKGETEIENEGEHLEPGGEEIGFFHTGGSSHENTEREGQAAHYEEGGKSVKPQLAPVKCKHFIPICVDKNNGSFVIIVTPETDAENGVIDLFLSAETQDYEIPIKSASVIREKEPALRVLGNRIIGLHFTSGVPKRISITIDYYDRCAMEVKLYEIKK